MLTNIKKRDNSGPNLFPSFCICDMYSDTTWNITVNGMHSYDIKCKVRRNVWGNKQNWRKDPAFCIENQQFCDIEKDYSNNIF